MGPGFLIWRVLVSDPHLFPSEQAESGLRFLGLIIFENKLKPGTAPAIRTLREAHLPCRMVTGDNPRTAVSVARECGIVNQTAHVFYPAFIAGEFSVPCCSTMSDANPGKVALMILNLNSSGRAWMTNRSSWMIIA